MNKRAVFHTTGYIMLAEAALMLLPTLVAWGYGEHSALSLLISAGICGVAGLILLAAFRTKRTAIYAKEGFVIVALSWLLMSLFGALPFFISGRIPSYIDAFFETVSGFTTTGATILNDVESLGRGLLFWRSLTHWIGGMGVLVFLLVVLPLGGDRSIHIMRAEVPGPTAGKLVPKMRNTAKILYLMYFGLTILEIIMLLCGGMNLYDSIITSFGTAGTGGFSNYTDSIAHFNSPFLEYVIGVFMLLFGINFNLYYLILIKKGREVLKSEELRVYLAIVLVSVAAITVNTLNIYSNLSEAFRYAFFQVSSIITTTGFITSDYGVWPQLSKTILIVLMIVGACAGSTGGGIKVSRVMLLLRNCKQGISQMLHPKAVTTVQLDGKPVDRSVLQSAGVYFICYALICVISIMALSFDASDFETDFSVVISCLNNVGPAMGIIGATNSYFDFTVFSKLVLSMDMLFGRLEIFPMLILFSPTVWKINASGRRSR